MSTTSAPPRFPPLIDFYGRHQFRKKVTNAQRPFPAPFYLLLRLAGPADEPAPPAPSRAPTKPQILRLEPTGGLPMPQR